MLIGSENKANISKLLADEIGVKNQLKIADILVGKSAEIIGSNNGPKKRLKKRP